MEWADKFYSESGKWWAADNKITSRDEARVNLIKRFAPPPKRLLELGSSYGNTAAAEAGAGYDVTGIELSDRFDSSNIWTDKEYPGSLKLVKGDFYEAIFEGKFDVVAYWNGFGIGSDEDQKRLLVRMSKEWLEDDGVVLMDVQNPYVWKRWAEEGGEELKADPERGYNYNISEEIKYDNEKGIVTDTWWVTEHPDERISQELRCYTTQELIDLLTDTGLKLDSIIIDGKELSLEEAEELLKDSAQEYSEYLVKLSLLD